MRPPLAGGLLELGVLADYWLYFWDCRVINLVAEDNAIEDTIYHLHRALNAGRIDLDRFIRVSRAPSFLIRSVLTQVL